MKHLLEILYEYIDYLGEREREREICYIKIMKRFQAKSSKAIHHLSRIKTKQVLFIV